MKFHFFYVDNDKRLTGISICDKSHFVINIRTSNSPKKKTPPIKFTFFFFSLSSLFQPGFNLLFPIHTRVRGSRLIIRLTTRLQSLPKLSIVIHIPAKTSNDHHLFYSDDPSLCFTLSGFSIETITFFFVTFGCVGRTNVCIVFVLFYGKNGE